MLICLFPCAALPCAAQGVGFFFPGASMAVGRTATETEMLIPGGQPFGIRMQSRGVMVVSLSEVVSHGKTVSPAGAAGLRARDVIIAVGGKKVASAEDVTEAIRASGGAPLALSILRGEEEKTIRLTPVPCDKTGSYAGGLYIRDSASGIGTITFLMPESGLFGGLGHGVCDHDTGALVPLSAGSVLAVAINGATRGEAGHPGELRGSFTGKRLGGLVTNSECGVFGLLTEPPQSKYPAMPVGAASEVREGEATILCTLGDDGIGEYKVEISKIDHSARPTKSFTIHVTDERLLARTGGIVQGM